MFYILLSLNVFTGTYREINNVANIKVCVRKCCSEDSCNVVFMTNDKCYHIECLKSDLCTPMLSDNAEMMQNIAMVLVNPVLADESWSDFIEFQSEF